MGLFQSKITGPVLAAKSESSLGILSFFKAFQSILIQPGLRNHRCKAQQAFPVPPPGACSELVAQRLPLMKNDHNPEESDHKAV